ncbi:MAG: type II restriction endonuclease, partial [Terriglobia bacterium]
MARKRFGAALQGFAKTLNGVVSTRRGDWVVKGFIDIAKNIYTISADTKVISKVMELLLFPIISKFADSNGLRMVLSREQNFYPDITFVDKNEHKFALDLKSTYRRSSTEVSGMTLGAFTGYFRQRDSKKNIAFPYNEYAGHFVLGIVYSRARQRPDEKRVYPLRDLKRITSVVRDFEFFCQEKYKIATDRPGSGNTKNIGSVTSITHLVRGRGPFARLGARIFDD